MTGTGSHPTRREFLLGSLALLGSGFVGIQPAGRLLGTVPLSRPNAAPLGRLLGAGLDGRLFTNLSTLTPDSMTTSNEQFYVRTACPGAVRDTSSWSISIGGLVKQPLRVNLSSFQKRAESMGACLIECSGNSDPNNFGLISSGTWAGIPMAAVLERVERLPTASLVLVNGIDDSVSRSGTSVPGASWIFDFEQLREAFLATEMNGQPLPRDHGAPVRLIVPGWYGCTCIKWVNEITVVDRMAAATPHMREFAARTHQRADPALARDFLPATIDHAAIPIRIEKREEEGRLYYRVVGILWGGSQPTNALGIRLGSDQPLVPVEDCPLPRSTRTWTLWTHRWTPTASGRYEITLRVLDPAIRTRRLDASFYRRSVDIAEV